MGLVQYFPWQGDTTNKRYQDVVHRFGRQLAVRNWEHIKQNIVGYVVFCSRHIPVTMKKITIRMYVPCPLTFVIGPSFVGDAWLHCFRRQTRLVFVLCCGIFFTAILFSLFTEFGSCRILSWIMWIQIRVSLSHNRCC